MWQVTANPDAFEEAEAWLRARTPLLKSDWLAVSEAERRRAFTIAGVARLSIIQDTLAALEEAVANGETLAEFKARVGPKLYQEWGKPNSTRLSLIFRNGVQHAYNAGRYQLATHPEVLRARPYWMFDAVLDKRTSAICRSADGTILPADHEYWNTHYPPLHHFCRSSVRTLTEAQAKAYGIAETMPQVTPSAGFGYTPDVPAWKPLPADYGFLPVEAVQALITAPPLTGKEVRERLLETEEEHTKLVKSLLDDAEKLLEEWKADGQVFFSLDYDDPRREELRAIRTAKLRRVSELEEKAKAAQEGFSDRLFNFLKADKPLDLEAVHINRKGAVMSGKRKHEEGWKEGLEKFKQLVGDIPGLSGQKVSFMELPPSGRAFYRQSEKAAYLTPDQEAAVIVHELGHWLEYNAPGIQAKVFAYYERRTQAYELEKLQKWHKGYEDWEVTKADQFIDPYTGKWYANADGSQRSTELLSMGLEYFIRSPLYFAKHDPDHFEFIWDLIRGLI